MMKKKLIILIALFVITGVTASAFAAEPQWFGGAHDRDWANAVNWNANNGPVPAATDDAKINYVWGNPGPIITNQTVNINSIRVSEDRDPGTDHPQTLTVATGGVLNVGVNSGWSVILGYNGADPRAPLNANEGSLIMDGGTATLGGHFFVGFTGIGHLEIDGGTLSALGGMFGLGWNGGSATVDISGGELHTEQWDFTHASSYSFNFSDIRTALGDGEWVQNHFWQNEIQALVDDGKITTTVPGAHVQVDWDPVLQQTHVYAIPEPVSIVLLGLGALCLRRDLKRT